MLCRRSPLDEIFPPPPILSPARGEEIYFYPLILSFSRRENGFRDAYAPAQRPTISMPVPDDSIYFSLPAATRLKNTYASARKKSDRNQRHSRHVARIKFFLPRCPDK